MPLKFGFQRRKSSSNDLLEAAAAAAERPQSSFRVLERPSTATTSFDGGHPSRRRANSEIRPFSVGPGLDYRQGHNESSDTKRSSGSTHLSDSSGYYETSASSIRYSNPSTVPSTASLGHFEDTAAKSSQVFAAPRPTTSSPNFLKSAGKALSFGPKKTENTSQPLDISEFPRHSTIFNDIPEPVTRKRASTELSPVENTTTISSKTAYGNNWNGVAPSQNNWRMSVQDENQSFSRPFMSNQRTSTEPLRSEHGQASSSNQTFTTPQMAPPPPIHVNRNYTGSPGPYTGTSRGSFDGLMSRSPPYEEEEDNTYEYRSGFNPSRTLTDSPSRNLTESPAKPYDHDGHNSNRSSGPILDEDTRNMLGFFNSGHNGYASVPAMPSSPLRTHQTPPADYEYHHKGVTLHDGEFPDDSSIQQSRQSSLEYTKSDRPQPPKIEPELDTDLDFQEMARSAARIEAGEQPIKERPQLSGKVMSAAKFEQYKKEQDLYRNNSNATEKSEKNEDEEYEEEDELERNREMAKQRRKQEAKMSVYRQQMMKVTGEKIAPQVTTPTISLDPARDSKGKDSSSEDEDENIPLGILAAHGFPSKQRPPSHLSPTASPSIRHSVESNPSPAASQTGSQSLPAFARNLPQDPYFGASIVNQSVREPIGYGTSSRAGSVYGGSENGSPRMQPGGLIGVIAKEEQARALRRGGPTTTFESSNHSVGLSTSPSFMPGYGQAPSSPLLSPESQAQIAINQQMQQMMQMQMQWMQQMMAMQSAQLSGTSAAPGMNVSQSMPLAPGLNMNQNMSRNSQHLQPGNTNARNSTMLPTAQQSLSAGPKKYAVSIAPSERSNVGQPSRYRPVSIAPLSNGRASTILNSNSGSDNAKVSTRPYLGSSLSAPNLIVSRPQSTLKPVTVKAVAEDEDEAWEELRRKKESKKQQWRSKKAQMAEGKENSLEGVFYPTEIP